jgi:endonuclease-3
MDLIKVIKILEKEAKTYKVPVITFLAQTKRDPFRALIGTVLSLRTKDEVTAKACEKLFLRADNVESMNSVSEKEISKLIYPVGFYKTKAKNIKKICSILIEKHDSKVPSAMEELLSLPNVGRKTANLVLIEGFDMDGVCVDTHVHQITNRIGFIRTKNPNETEMKLRKKIPKKYWKRLNYILVAFGQHLCVPVSPFCSRCVVREYCKRIGVKTSR